MMMPDVNVLVYALRYDSSHHRVCRNWLNQVIDRDVRIALSPLVLSAVVRIATNAKSYKQPSSLDEAFGYCSELRSLRTAHLIEPSERHWGIFEKLCKSTETRGGRVSDAWFAALAIDWGCEWISVDGDFARFPGLKWSRPGDCFVEI